MNNFGTATSGDRLRGTSSPKGEGEAESKLPIQEAARPSAAVRAAIVAWKSANSDGAKGGRKAKELKP
jgi:hypothetical protein